MEKFDFLILARTGVRDARDNFRSFIGRGFPDPSEKLAIEKLKDLDKILRELTERELQKAVAEKP